MKPAFSEEFQNTYLQSKYTRWAQDLDAPTLQALIWFVGELSVRTDEQDLESLRRISPDYNKCRRDIALEAIILIKRGVRYQDKNQIRLTILNGINERWEERVMAGGV